MTLIDGKAISEQVKQEIAAEEPKLWLVAENARIWRLSLLDTMVVAKRM